MFVMDVARMVVIMTVVMMPVIMVRMIVMGAAGMSRPIRMPMVVVVPMIVMVAVIVRISHRRNELRRCRATP